MVAVVWMGVCIQIGGEKDALLGPKLITVVMDGIALIGSGMVRTMNKEQQEFWDKLKHGNRGCLNCAHSSPTHEECTKVKPKSDLTNTAYCVGYYILNNITHGPDLDVKDHWEWNGKN